MGAVDLVVQVEAPPSVAAGLQRVGRAGHQVGAVSRGRDVPEVPRGPGRVGRRRRADAGRADRVDALPAQPAGRAGPAGRRDGGDGAVAGRGAGRAGAAGGAVRRPCRPRRWSRCWTCCPGATRRTSSPSCGRGWCGTGSSGTLTGRPGAQRLAVTSGGTIPDRGLFGVFLVAGAGRDRPAGRRARRGDGVRVARRRRLPARLDVVAGRGDHPRPGAGHPGAGTAGQDAVLARATRPAGRSSWAGRWAPSCASWAGCRPSGPRRGRARPDWTTGAPATCWPTWPSSGRRPGTCRTTARCWWSDSATSSATGGWSCTPPSARRSTRRGRWRSSPASASGTGWTCSPCTPTTASCCGCRRPTGSRRAARWRCSSRRRSSRWSPPRSAGRRCSRPGSGSARPGRCCCPSATRGGAPRCGSSASGRPTCCRWPAGTASFPMVLETMRECLQDVFDVPGLVGLMTDLRSRTVRMVEVETPQPSPFARSLLFGYVGMFLYEGDAPLAERRAPGAVAGHRAAGRAARPGRAARAARRGRGGRGRSCSCSG